jgi:hypothetical protein
MPPKKNSVRKLAIEAGLSLGHINAARKAGVDTSDLEALKAYRKVTPPRVDGRLDRKRTPTPPADAGQMTIEEIEAALRSKGIDITSAKILKTQLDGLKAAMGYRRETSDLIPREDVKAAFVRIASALSAALRVAEAEIPQRCLGLPLAESRPIAKEILRGIQAKLADGESEFWQEHPNLV